MKIGISTSCLYPMYTEQALSEIAAHNIPITEVFFNANCELQPLFIEQLKSIKNSSGIEIGSIHPTMSLAESFTLFSNYDRRFYEGIEQFKRYGEIASSLGAKYVIMHGGKPNGTMDNHGYFEKFYKVSQAVAQNGAVLLQENVVKFRLGSLEALCDMSDYLGDEVGFCLDVKQSIRGGYSPYDVLRNLKHKIKHLHISDSNAENDCMLPMRGDFDFKKFLTTAAEFGYTGNAIVEVYNNAYADKAELFESYDKLIKKVL